MTYLRMAAVAVVWILASLLLLRGGLAWGSIQPRDPEKCSRVVVARVLAGQRVVLVPWNCPQLSMPPWLDVTWLGNGRMRLSQDGRHVATLVSREIAAAPAAPRTTRTIRRRYWTTITTSSGQRERAQITEVEREERP